MIDPTTLAALATTLGAHWLTPNKESLSLLIRTSDHHHIAPAAKPLWRPLSRSLYETRATFPRLRMPTAGPLDAVVMAKSAGGKPIPQPVPSIILTSAPLPDWADRFIPVRPYSDIAFADLIGRLLDTAPPDEPAPATWAFGVPVAVGEGPGAANVLRVATILAATRDWQAPAIAPGDVALARSLTGLSA